VYLSLTYITKRYLKYQNIHVLLFHLRAIFSEPGSNVILQLNGSVPYCYILYSTAMSAWTYQSHSHRPGFPREPPVVLVDGVHNVSLLGARVRVLLLSEVDQQQRHLGMNMYAVLVSTTFWRIYHTFNKHHVIKYVVHNKSRSIIITVLAVNTIWNTIVWRL